MLGTVFTSLFIALGALHADAPAVIEQSLSQPILIPGQTRTELESFVLTRLPELHAPETAKAWSDTAEMLRVEVLEQAVLKGVPEEWLDAPLRVEWLGTIQQFDDYRIRKLRYEAVPGLWIPALLYEPVNSTKKMPAVLNVNGHVGEPGKAVDYKQLRCINLAKRGIVNLNPEWYRMGELEGKQYGHDRIAYLDLAGVSGLSLFYLSMKRGLDILESHPQSDPERLAVTGLSGGGWQTILISSLDPRVALSAPNAGYIGTPTRMQHTSDIGDLEQVPSDLLSIADYTHLTAIRAPKPTLLIYNATDNCCFQAYRAKSSVYDPIRSFYALYDADKQFAFHENHTPGTHNYDLDNRQQFYAFLNAQFGLNTPDTEIPSEGEILSREVLDVGIPEDNESIISLALQVAEALPKSPIPARDSKKFQRWAKKTRKELHSVLRIKNDFVPTVQSAQLTATSKAGLKVATYKLRIGEWTVPAVYIAPSDTTSNDLAIVIADQGRASQAPLIAELLASDAGVLAIDPVYIGEAMFHAQSNSGYAMFHQSAGGRLLGEHVQQLTAISHWARDTFPAQRITLHARGTRMSVAALTAGAIDPDTFDTIHAPDAPDSFIDLIRDNRGYSKHESLFCFGLLKVADLPALRVLAE